MRKQILFILSFISLNVYCQKKIVVSENAISERFHENLDSLISKYNFKDLRRSDERTIRIWGNNEVLLLGKNLHYFFHTWNGHKTISRNEILKSKSNYASIFSVFSTNAYLGNTNEHRPIDAYPITVEINNSKTYKIISFYKNEQFEELIKNIKTENSIYEARKKIVENLPAGNYRIGLTTVKVDHLPENELSDFYRKIEPEIKKKLKINKSTNPTNMPLVMVNNELQFFQDLNELSLSDVLSYEIIEDNKKFLYGTRGIFGVINVTTKLGNDTQHH